MPSNFNNMTKEELFNVVRSPEFQDMTLAELNSLRKAASAAGILDSFDGDKVAMLINNKTYDAIKTDDKNYTAEEKALAKSSRDEYNDEIRVNRAKEILKRATNVDGKYVFDTLSKGEMDLLLKSGVVSFNDMKISQEEYKIGQENKANIANILQALQKNAEKREAAAATKPQEKPAKVKVESKTENKTENKVAPVVVNEEATPAMPADLQKSYDFWNKFNENTAKTGVKYQIDNIENKHLLVEAKKGDKTIFQGIDHGSKGFDIIKRDKDADAYEMFDLLVKKVKARNPKTAIRIKDNVTDEVLRNKILIACAKNNMKPVGNLPEGFDFEALKEQVKDLKTTDEINALAENLHVEPEYSFGAENANANNNQPRKKRPVGGIVLVNTGNGGGNPPANRGNNNGGNNHPIIPIIPVNTGNGGNGGGNPPFTPTPPSNRGNNNDGNNHPIIPIIPVNTGNGGNGGGNPPATTEATKEEGALAKLWKKTRKWVVGGLIIAAGLFGIKSCQQAQQAGKDKDTIENLSAKNDSLSTVVDGLNKDKVILQGALDDCNESKKPKPAPVRKPTKRKPVVTKPVVTAPVVTEPVAEPIVTAPVVTPPAVVAPIVTTPVVTTPENDPSNEIDIKGRHSPAGVRSTPSSRDAEDAANDVIDFGDRHGIHDNLSSDTSNGLTSATTPKGNASAAEVSQGEKTINFYDALALYNKSKGNGH